MTEPTTPPADVVERLNAHAAKIAANAITPLAADDTIPAATVGDGNPSGDDPVMPVAPIPDTQIDSLSEAARTEAMMAQAIESIVIEVARLQGLINDLNAITTAQANDIKRLTAAVSAHACPEKTEVATLTSTTEMHPASVIECVNAGLCSCEVGYILTAETWTPPQ